MSALVPDLSSRFDELLRRLGEIYDLQRAGQLLAWDQETKMPPLGAAARAEQLATLARLAHDRATAPELGELLEELRELEESSEPESFEASLIRVARHDYEKKRSVPSELRAEMTPRRLARLRRLARGACGRGLRALPPAPRPPAGAHARVRRVP